jgi:hypothetical protein
MRNLNLRCLQGFVVHAFASTELSVPLRLLELRGNDVLVIDWATPTHESAIDNCKREVGKRGSFWSSSWKSKETSRSEVHFSELDKPSKCCLVVGILPLSSVHCLHQGQSKGSKLAIQNLHHQSSGHSSYASKWIKRDCNNIHTLTFDAQRTLALRLSLICFMFAIALEQPI